MDLVERLYGGLDSAIMKHWTYQKRIYDIKPEYLFTVAVADELTKGFYKHRGQFLLISLEKKTKDISFNIRMNKIGMVSMLSQPYKVVTRDGKTGGKVDIFVEDEDTNESYVIELKGFDPQPNEIVKEINRFVSFFNLHDDTTLVECAIAFPTKKEKRGWINKHIENCSIPDTLATDTYIKCVETGEDPEDGDPTYWANIVILKKKTT